MNMNDINMSNINANNMNASNINKCHNFRANVNANQCSMNMNAQRMMHHPMHNQQNISHGQFGMHNGNGQQRNSFQGYH